MLKTRVNTGLLAHFVVYFQYQNEGEKYCKMAVDQAYVTELENTIKQLQSQVEELTEMVNFFRKQMFGPSSEKTPKEELSNQISMFNEAEACADPKAEDPSFKSPKNRAGIKKHLRNEQFTKKLPVEEITYEINDDEKFCEICGSPLKVIGKEFIREEIQFIPASLKIIRYFKSVYECPKCKHTDHPYITYPMAMMSLMSHSLASPSSVAYVMYQKYVNAVPLYRQEKDWEKLGLILSRATMANWVIRCSQDYLYPIIDKFKEELRKREVLHVDETPVQVLKEEGKTPQSKSYMWLYTTGDDDKNPIVIYDYKPTRNGDNAVKFLEGFKGYVHSDGFSGYNKLNDVTRCGCWAHLRRKFVEACPEKKIEGSSKTVAEVGRDFCNQLFDIERTLKDLTPEDRYIRRLELEKPVLKAFWCWLDEQNPLGGGKLSKAIHYAREQKPYLENYLLDGRCSISNNTAENAIRPFTVGRKNWLFSDTAKGAEASAAVYSIVETAKANGLEVYSYLEYLLDNVRDLDWQRHPERLDNMMPWSETVKAECSR